MTDRSVPGGRVRQGEIYTRGLFGERPKVPTSWPGLQREARKRLSGKAYAYLMGGAGLESTMAADRAAFERRTLRPRILRDVSRRRTTIDLFGRTLPGPVLLAPIGALGLLHPDADLAVARAAAATGIPYILSSQASVPMELCAAAMGDSPRWFQLYWSTSDDLVASLVERAERSGCDAIVVTLDTTMLGWRPRDLDLGHLPFAAGHGIAQYTSDPVFQRLVAAAQPSPRPRPALQRLPAAARTLLSIARRHPGRTWPNLRSPTPRAAVQTFLGVYSRPSLTWADLPTLRRLTRLPVLLKGILHPDDARRAVDAGVDGLIVSTHGGRQVDGARGALDCLPDVVRAVDGRLPVLMDSGVRGGADVVKALALGAVAVCLGRPYVCGLAIAGAAGVEEVIRNVLAEFDLTLGLCGLTSLAEVGPDVFGDNDT